MDTASNAGPRFAFEGFAGSFPHVVPFAPAPKSATAGEAEEDEGEEPLAIAGADEVLEAVSSVMDAGFIDVADEAAAVAETEAADAEAKTLGQKVLLHVCTSVGQYCQY